MKYEKVQAMTDAELANSLEELRREKLTLKIQSRTGQLEKSARVREVRRDIARVLTEQASRAAKANN
ncbi:MAG: 50S ribosomal protein L29 [Victivallaceae bacterium]